MDRIVAIVFNELRPALAGQDALKSLDHEENITLYEHAIVTKKS